MKKIAFFVDSFPTISETFIISQISYLKRRGYDITVFSRHKTKQNKVHAIINEENLFDNVTFFDKIPNSYFKRLSKILIFLVFNFSLTTLFEIISCLNIYKFGKPAGTLFIAYNYIFLKKFQRYDIIHAHFGWCGKIVSYYMHLKILKNKRFITTFHGADIDLNNIQNLRNEYKFLFEYCDYLTVNSQYSYKLLCEIKGDCKNIFILPAGLDTSLFTPIDGKIFNPKIFKILFCGRLVKLKGIFLIPKIIQKLVESTDKKIQCIIVGSGNDEMELRNKINFYGLSDICTMVGEATQHEYLQYLRDSYVFIFPGIRDPNSNRAETQGLVVQEAQSAEVPVLVSDVGGIKYGLRDGVSGYVVREGDIDAYVEKLLLLISNPDLCQSLGKEGRRYVVENFDFNFLGKKLEYLYNEQVVYYKI